MKCNGIHNSQIETYNEYIVSQIYSSFRLDKLGSEIALVQELNVHKDPPFPHASRDQCDPVPGGEVRRAAGGVRYDVITTSAHPSQSAPGPV